MYVKILFPNIFAILCLASQVLLYITQDLIYLLAFSLTFGNLIIWLNICQHKYQVQNIITTVLQLTNGDDMLLLTFRTFIWNIFTTLETIVKSIRAGAFHSVECLEIALETQVVFEN